MVSFLTIDFSGKRLKYSERIIYYIVRMVELYQNKSTPPPRGNGMCNAGAVARMRAVDDARDRAEVDALAQRNKRYIYCSFDEKDECKQNGGKWDADKKRWYIPEGIDNESFKKWFYPYKNHKNYIEKQILYWFYRFRVKKNMNTGVGKWLIFIDVNSTNMDKLEYLQKKVGITGFKIWQDKRPHVKEHFNEDEACICIYCGLQSKSFEEQKEWIKYIGFNISKDCYLKSISKREKIWFKANEDTRNFNYSFNSKSSKLNIRFKND